MRTQAYNTDDILRMKVEVFFIEHIQRKNTASSTEFER